MQEYFESILKFTLLGMFFGLSIYGSYLLMKNYPIIAIILIIAIIFIVLIQFNDYIEIKQKRKLIKIHQLEIENLKAKIKELQK